MKSSVFGGSLVLSIVCAIRVTTNDEPPTTNEHTVVGGRYQDRAFDRLHLVFPERPHPAAPGQLGAQFEHSGVGWQRVKCGAGRQTLER